jgi:hypothetical protein
LPKGGKTLIKTLALECDLEIPDEFFEHNTEIGREEYEEELLGKFDKL